MLQALASLLFLGAVPSARGPRVMPRPPGIEIVSVASPSILRTTVEMPPLSASGILLIDRRSGQELMSLNADERRPMASLTKIMTALLILNDHRLSEIVTVPPIAESIGGSGIRAKTGERLSARDMLKALLIPSANDAAYALANFHSKGIAGFVRAMNERAHALGLANTNFANPAGLDDPAQFSTPRDLAWLTIAALRYPAFREITGTRAAVIYGLDGGIFEVRNTNELLHDHPEVLGVKTGTTSNAGECLIILFTEQEREYLLVLLKSSDRYADALRVLQAVKNAS